MAINPSFYRDRERKQTTFDRMVPQYFLNSKGQLEESPIMVDTQEKINSVVYTRLDEIYDKFLAINNEMHTVHNGGDMIVEREALEDDLSLLIEFDNMKNRYASDNPEVAGMDFLQMHKYVTNKLNTANDNIKDFVNNRSIEKEVQTNAKDIEKKSE